MNGLEAECHREGEEVRKCCKMGEPSINFNIKYMIEYMFSYKEFDILFHWMNSKLDTIRCLFNVIGANASCDPDQHVSLTADHITDRP